MRRIIVAVWTACVLGAAVAAAQSAAEGEKLLEAARHKEVVSGDLKGAAEQYRKIATQFAKQPEIAAEALYQLGQCQEKLGQAEARRSYERVVREYGSAHSAGAAKARLAALGGAAGTDQQTMRPVWTGRAVSSEWSISQDGRFVTYPDWDSGNLGLHDLTTGRERLLTKDGSWKPGANQYAEMSAISRDGKQVAYAWYDDKTDAYELRALSLTGDTTPRQILRSADINYIEPVDWSPDGKWIVAEVSRKNRADEVVLIGAADGSLRIVKSAQQGGSWRVSGFSADGKNVAYTRTAGNGTGQAAYVASVDGAAETPLVRGALSGPAAWTPDGTHIVFISDLSGAPGLWSIAVTDGKPVGEPKQLKASFADVVGLRFTRDGSMFYTVRKNPSDIYVAGLDSAGKLTGEPKRINQRIGSSWGRVAWLPDGKSLSFWNRVPIGALVEHTVATGEEREILGGKTGRIPYGYMGWFPDGTLAARDAGKSLLLKLDGKSGAELKRWSISQLGTRAGSFAPSPDQMTVYHVEKDANCQGSTCRFSVGARDVETGRDREVLTVQGSFIRGLSVSPDGKQLAAVLIDVRGRAVLVASTAGGEPREIYRGGSDNEGGFLYLVWTADGKHVLATRALPKGGGELWSFPVSGGAPEKSAMKCRPMEQPAVGPDGSQIALVGGSNEAEIWVITGLLNEIAKR
jgi:Tol biopolymer transport system component